MSQRVISPEHIWIVDTFTSKPFLGNAAAVCLLDAFPDDGVLQLTALSMQLSETAYLVEKSPLHYELRWFTPEVEVNLCGHATLASTHVLGQMGKIKKGETVTFDTMSGALTATLLETGAVELNFPTLESEPAKPHMALSALGVDMVNCELARDNYIVEVKDYAALISCMPNFKKLSKMDAQGVIVTTATGIPVINGPNNEKMAFDFASRYFCPVLGIDEDPVTGSAHCTLAPYWAQRLGKTQFRAFQASKGKGQLTVTLKGSRTLIAGQSVTTLKGTTLPTQAKDSVPC
ncbi:MAG: PhzF family phenazine biosynthesis protein [Rickettsiales bacterium]|nr:PhzF family phenazine biosynthesis protein [Rickettsiales bacterium]